jgi:light-regulated signal transduction histidine kinase (bacteriophytochrome)
LARHADELRQANAELEHFGAMASRDLADPLQHVRGYLQLFALDHAEGLDADGRDLVGRALRGIDRMRSLVNDLVLFSHVGTVSPVQQSVDCGALVNDVLDSNADLISEAGARVIVDSLPTVESDPFLLRPVFEKLVTHALHTRDPGLAPRIQVSAERGPRAWHFSVADNGPGLWGSAGDADQAFEITQSFRRSAEFPGTGMGLAIGKRIVDRLGGSIWVAPDAGGGNAVHFSIPD